MEDHNARAGSGNVVDLVVGGVRQHSTADVALGAADDRLPPEFPDSAAAENLLHTHRVDLTEIDRHITFIIRYTFYIIAYSNTVDNIIKLSHIDSNM